MMVNPPCACGSGQPCPSHVQGFGSLLDPSGMAGITLDQLASLSLIALVALQFYQFFSRRGA